MTQGFDDLIFGFCGEGLTIAKIPCFWIMAALAVIPAAADEK